METIENSMNIEAIISTVLLISTGILAWMQWRSNVRKQASESKVDDASAAEKIGNAYDALLNRLGVRISELEGRVTDLEHELKRYTTWSARLVTQLVENGIEPLKLESDPKLVKGKTP